MAAQQQQVVETSSHVEEVSCKLVGRPVKRSEDRRLLSGHDHFIDNLKFQGIAFAGFVRSPYAHARIKKINLSQNIQSDPRVLAIITPEEVRKETNPIPVVWKLPPSKIHEHYALAQGVVNHVGDPVLAIAVRDRESLEDVLEQLEIEYEPLEPVLDATKASSLPPIHEELGTNICYEIPISSGDADKALSEADVIVSGTFKLGRVAAAPMETRGVVALPNGPESSLTLYSSTQWPHVLRMLLSTCLKMPENELRVIGPDVGGGFGVKGEVYPEEILVAMLARKCEKPVKWIESRKENFVATTHARDQILDAKAGFTKDGILTSLKVNILCDFGAYLHTITEGCGLITAISFNGPYHIPNFYALARCVYTNKTGLSAYRGFGQPEAAFTVERLMSIAASKLGIDQAEIRFRNLISPSEMPYKTCSGGMIDSGDYTELLRKALSLAKYDELAKSRDASHKEGGSRLRGVGISLFTETTGFAPGFVFELLGVNLGGYDSASVKMDSQGKLTVTTGAFPHGQGFNTALAQICADELGLEFGDVFSFHGDTHSSPFGQGSFGSRSVAVAGSAALEASKELAMKIKVIGSHILKLDKAEDTYLSHGFLISKLDPSKKVAIQDIAKAAYIAHNLPEGVSPGLESTLYFSPRGLGTSYAAHIVELEVDRESGIVKVLKEVSVSDCGNVINPMIVEGQIHGGVAQALGACFLEELAIDASGQVLSGSFMDYLLPTAETMPSTLLVGSTITPTPINPLGAKGIGESGTIIAPAAFANALSDALGVEINSIPMTPEKVWNAVHR